MEVIRHFKLAFSVNLAKIEGKKVQFKNIGRLIEHYRHHRIDPALRNIGIAYNSSLYELGGNGDSEEVETVRITLSEPQRERRKICTLL